MYRTNLNFIHQYLTQTSPTLPIHNQNHLRSRAVKMSIFSALFGQRVGAARNQDNTAAVVAVDQARYMTSQWAFKWGLLLIVGGGIIFVLFYLITGSAYVLGLYAPHQPNLSASAASSIFNTTKNLLGHTKRAITPSNQTLDTTTFKTLKFLCNMLLHRGQNSWRSQDRSCKSKHSPLIILSIHAKA